MFPRQLLTRGAVSLSDPFVFLEADISHLRSPHCSSFRGFLVSLSQEVHAEEAGLSHDLTWSHQMDLIRPKGKGRAPCESRVTCLHVFIHLCLLPNGLLSTQASPPSRLSERHLLLDSARPLGARGSLAQVPSVCVPDSPASSSR